MSPETRIVPYEDLHRYPWLDDPRPQLVARLDDGDIAAIGIIGGLVMLLAALCV